MNKKQVDALSKKVLKCVETFFKENPRRMTMFIGVTEPHMLERVQIISETLDGVDYEHRVVPSGFYSYYVKVYRK